jgi:hypothetical protein
MSVFLSSGCWRTCCSHFSLFHHAFQFNIYNGPTNALVCNKTLIQMSYTKTLKITPTCFDHQMIIWWSKHVGVILSVLVCDIRILLQTSALVGPLYILNWNARWNGEIEKHQPIFLLTRGNVFIVIYINSVCTIVYVNVVLWRAAQISGNIRNINIYIYIYIYIYVLNANGSQIDYAR